MRNASLLMKLALVAGLWLANSVLATPVTAKEPDRCYQVCWPWVPCDTECLHGSTIITCGQTSYGCS